MPTNALPWPVSVCVSVCVCVCVSVCMYLVIQSCLTLCNPMDYSLPGSSVHGIFQTRIPEWVAIPFSSALPNPGIEPGSPALQADSLPSEPPGNPTLTYRQFQTGVSLLLCEHSRWVCCAFNHKKRSFPNFLFHFIQSWHLENKLSTQEEFESSHKMKLTESPFTIKSSFLTA